MYCCQQCAKEHNFEFWMPQSYGPCEICGGDAGCVVLSDCIATTIFSNKVKTPWEANRPSPKHKNRYEILKDSYPL